MAILEDIMSMKRQGFSDEQIVNEFAQRGISPREINDALNQAQIKNAVTDYGDEGQPSIMQGDESVPSPNQAYQPAYPQEQEQQYTPQEEYQPQEAQQQYYQPGEQQQYAPAVDTDTMMEISDQVFSDKIKKFQKVLDATSEAAIVLQTKIENISERLKKIETTIDKLQIAILEKVGSYGQNLDSIKKEMSMMQDSFSKMVSPLRESRKQIESSEKVPETNEQETTRRIPRKNNSK